MKTVIIGGGAAGMLCAYFCAKNGEQTILIEKNEKLGKKLYITGKGRCNLTNDCSVEEFLSCVVTNPRFLTSALYSFSPDDVMNFLLMLDDKGYLKPYLRSIKEFFEISINLDLIDEAWEESKENPKLALKIYKKKLYDLNFASISLLDKIFFIHYILFGSIDCISVYTI